MLDKSLNKALNYDLFGSIKSRNIKFDIAVSIKAQCLYTIVSKNNRNVKGCRKNILSKLQFL